MKPTFNDKLIAYLVLLSGLAISGVAEYYSIMGLIAIYPTAVWPIIIMGVVLGMGKITGTIWLKQNWNHAPWFLKTYILPAILILMVITSLGVFGYLSKAHSDQSLVSGDVMAKISVYDEKIKTARENIDANRKALKQMDEAVDQVMARSTSETGADKAVGVRRAQQKERARLQSEIQAEQKIIVAVSQERAPIAAEIRKLEAEVGPIKYIAHLLYSENPDANILEKAVIWVTVLIVIVLDPLAVVLLLASQFSFQRFREQEEEQVVQDWFAQGKERARQLDDEAAAPAAELDKTPTETEQEETTEGNSPEKKSDVVSTATVTESTKLKVVEKESILDKHPYLLTGFDHFKNLKPLVHVPEVEVPVENIIVPPKPVTQQQESTIRRTKVFPVVRPAPVKEIISETYIQNEEQAESNLWSNTTVSNSEVEQIAHHAANIISGRATPGDVPEHMWEQVNAQVEQHASDILAGKMHTGEVPEHLWEQVKAKL